MAKEKKTDIIRHTCIHCGKSLAISRFYRTDNQIYKSNDYVTTICKDCVVKLYDYYFDLYDNENIKDKKIVHAKAIQRVCMILDIYYSDDIFENIYMSNNANSYIAAYIRMVNLLQHRKKTYDDTIIENEKKGFFVADNEENDQYKPDNETVKLFGEGFEPFDYKFLKKEYADWTSRHECSTKSQEEIFKAICMNRLKAYKSNIAGKDTKDLDKTFKELLDTGKLQPKQNKNEVSIESLSFGTFINQWENTRPIPKVDKELKDVDKIGLFLDVFFKGHLARMMGLKNGLSKYYDEYMQQFAIVKPDKSHKEDIGETNLEDSEAIFDALFGKSINNMGDDI